VPERSPFEPKEPEAEASGYVDSPSEFDLAEELGGAAPIKDEDQLPEATGELLALDEAAARIPAEAKVLMEELFRARPSKVRRINPKKIR